MKVKIKDNIELELKKLGFIQPDVLNRFIGTEQLVKAEWNNKGQIYYTIDICVEVPKQCCEILHLTEHTS